VWGGGGGRRPGHVHMPSVHQAGMCRASQIHPSPKLEDLSDAGHPPSRCTRQPPLSLLLILGVFVTREHVRHNKSGIAHRGRTRINHLRELPTKLDHFAAVDRLPCPAEPVNHRCTFGVRVAEKLGKQLVVPKSRAAIINLEKQVIPRAALGAQNGRLSYETVCWPVQPGQSAP
jgi:hypothetical protein